MIHSVNKGLTEELIFKLSLKIKYCGGKHSGSSGNGAFPATVRLRECVTWSPPIRSSQQEREESHSKVSKGTFIYSGTVCWGSSLFQGLDYVHHDDVDRILRLAFSFLLCSLFFICYECDSIMETLYYIIYHIYHISYPIILNILNIGYYRYYYICESNLQEKKLKEFVFIVIYISVAKKRSAQVGRSLKSNHIYILYKHYIYVLYYIHNICIIICYTYNMYNYTILYVT